MNYNELISSRVMKTKKSIITTKHYQVATMTIFRKATMDTADPTSIDMSALVTSRNWGRTLD